MDVAAVAQHAVLTARRTALLEGKHAMQTAVVLEGRSREQIIRSVMRWWKQGDLSRTWARWVAVAIAMESVPASPEPSHVRVSLLN